MKRRHNIASIHGLRNMVRDVRLQRDCWSAWLLPRYTTLSRSGLANIFGRYFKAQESAAEQLTARSPVAELIPACLCYQMCLVPQIVPAMEVSMGRHVVFRGRHDAVLFYGLHSAKAHVYTQQRMTSHWSTCIHRHTETQTHRHRDTHTRTHACTWIDPKSYGQKKIAHNHQSRILVTFRWSHEEKDQNSARAHTHTQTDIINTPTQPHARAHLHLTGNHCCSLWA